MTQRCTVVNERGQQCGDHDGHDGPHTALIATQFLVIQPNAQRGDR